MKPAQLRIGQGSDADENWKQLRVFFDNLPSAIVELGIPGSPEITYCNGAFSVLVADHAQGVTGTDLADLAANAADRDRLFHDISQAAGARDFDRPYSVLLRCRTGDEIPVRLDWLEKVSSEGESRGWLLFVQSLAPAAPSQERSIRRVFYEIVEKSGEAIGIATETGEHLYRNDAHKKLFGKADAPNADFNVMDILTPESIEKVITEVRQAVDETGQWVGVLDSKTPDGIKPIWVRTHEILDPVSDRPIRFAQMHDHSAELALRNKLAQTTLRAEQGQKAQQDLFLALSHDLRATLQAASLYLDTAARKTKRHGLEVEEIARAQEAVFSVQDYFKRVLDAFTSNASAIEPHVEYVNSQDLLDYLDRAYRPMAEAKGLEFTLVPCKNVFPSDPSLMKRIVGNLVSNAIKFTDSGEVRVDCPEIDGRIFIRVMDTGPGIHPEYHERIFDQFFRLSSDDADGMGVGLSITQGLCELLGHGITLSSEPGQGSVFTVTISPVEHL